MFTLSASFINFREIALSIDSVIYWFIKAVYNLLVDIASMQIFTQGTINELSERVYALIGIFMLFKLTLSMITYVVNPDDFSDKTKGFGSMIKNVIISLILIVLTPYIFAEAFELQDMVLKQNVLQNLVFGDKTSYSIDNGGSIMQFNLFSQFVKPNIDDFPDLAACKNIYELNDEGTGYKPTIVSTGDSAGEESNYNYMFNNECYNALDGKIDKKNKLSLELYKTAFETSNYSILTSSSANDIYSIEATTSNGFKEKIIKYSWPLTTITGAVTLLILIVFCIDIATRSLKLAFYQIIAPIPIISYCDPKSAKDGMFKKWTKACISTYLELFIRLVGLYLGMFVILLAVRDIKFNGLAIIFIIIGALIFAKQLPKIITDLTGIKMDGKFTLNPFKKIENEALGGSVVGKGRKLFDKGAKALALAPMGMAATQGKKIISGIDAARNGKGFKQGYNRVHGKLYNRVEKKIGEYMPDTLENIKEAQKGREEVAKMNTKWTKGLKAAQKLEPYARSKGYKKVYEAFDGSSEEAYKKVYSSQDFIKSRMALDKKDETRKALERISEATARGTSLKDALTSEKDNLKKYDAGLYSKYFDSNGNVKSNVEMTDFIKSREDTAKAVQGMEKVHESIRKQYQDDAAVEDQIKFIKYNPDDPTDQSRHYTGATGVGGSNGSSNNNGGTASGSNGSSGNNGGSGSGSNGSSGNNGGSGSGSSGSSGSSGNNGGSNSSNNNGGSNSSNNNGGSNSSNNIANVVAIQNNGLALYYQFNAKANNSSLNADEYSNLINYIRQYIDPLYDRLKNASDESEALSAFSALKTEIHSACNLYHISL